MIKIMKNFESNETSGYFTYVKNDNNDLPIRFIFRDGEFAEYKNAYDLQDFLNQVNHYHDLRKDFQTVVDKLLESKPELEELFFTKQLIPKQKLHTHFIDENFDNFESKRKTIKGKKYTVYKFY